MDPSGDGGGGLTTTGLFCGSCGAPLSATAKFCSDCGTPVTQTSRSAEYKQVTVLFADVVHSMDIAAAVGAERLREIMAELVDRCAAVVKRYGGTVDKFTGDGDHGGVRCAGGVGGPRSPRLPGRVRRSRGDRPAGRRGQRPRRCGPAAAGGTELRSGDRR